MMRLVDNRFAIKIVFKIRINAVRTSVRVLKPVMVSKHNINTTLDLTVPKEAIAKSS
jgi:hypothetical protein